MRGEASFVRDRVRGEDKGNVQVKISNYYDEMEALGRKPIDDGLHLYIVEKNMKVVADSTLRATAEASSSISSSISLYLAGPRALYCVTSAVTFLAKMMMM